FVGQGLVDRLGRAEAHRDGRVLPEVRHPARVRVGREAAALAGGRVGVLLTEPVEVLLGEPALEVGACVVPGGGVPLEEDVVAAARVLLAAEEVVHAHLVQRGQRGVGGDVAADGDTGTLRPGDHHRGVPPDPAAVGALDRLVTGEVRLLVDGDGVDV